jgi:acetylornithine aminotransferase
MTEGATRFSDLFMPTYAPYPAILSRGEGCRLYAEDGRSWLDFCAGIAVANVGHCHPRVVAAIREQAGRLMHVSNLYLHRRELELAEALLPLAFPGRLFLCQSGAEANETAIKLARKHARTVRGEDRPKVVACLNSFHGRTMGALAATGQSKYHAGFEPLPGGFVHVPYNDLTAMERACDLTTCAVMVEPLQAEGGIVEPAPGYLAGLRDLCDRRGILLIFDEVQTGFGRTGTLFAFQGEGVTPDIMTLAKAFGGGLPLGGVLARPEVAAAFVPGNHATTFGGNPVGCAAALAVLEVIHGENLLENCRAMGARLAARLSSSAARRPDLFSAVRGRGLLLGLETTRGARDLQIRCQEAGLFLSVVQERVLRFTPPLTVTAGEVDEAAGILDRVVEDFPA